MAPFENCSTVIRFCAPLDPLFGSTCST